MPNTQYPPPVPNPPDDKQALATGRLLFSSPFAPGGEGAASTLAPSTLARGEGEKRREYRAALISAGTVRRVGNKPSNLRIPAASLRDAAARGLFDNRPTFVDHPGWFDRASLRDMAGVTLAGTEWEEDSGAVVGTVRLYDNDAGQVIANLFDTILADAEAGHPQPDVGLSAVVWAGWKRVEEDDEGTSTWEMQTISHIESVDFVFEPGAEGRVRQALAALREYPRAEYPRAAAPPDPVGAPADVADVAGVHQPANVSTFQPTNERIVTMPPEEENLTNTEPPVSDLTASHPLSDSIDQWSAALAATATEAMIAHADLPVASRARLRRLASKPGAFTAPADVEAAIQAEREYLAQLVEDSTIQLGPIPPRGGHIALGLTGFDQVQQALEALIAGVRPPDGVRPLTGVREAYHLLSGDYEMHGIFQPDRIQFANVTSSTMAALVANAMNKVVVNMFQQYPHWWEDAVTVMDFTTLQDARWTTLGGVGELPTVAEGAAYTELTWDDQVETDSFVKKGGYLGITLEAIDKDDTGRLQAAPRALAQAAWLTLGKAVSEIFTYNSGVGPTMSDTGALFNATAVATPGGHANLLTTALSFAAWEAVKVAMMKQPELHSGERLGALTRPKLLWVPVDLETTALQILASEGEPGTADNDVNPFASGTDREARLANARKRVVVCPLWTDTNNWAAQADPLLYPSIGLGFRYGRTPEIFSVASPTAGLMFTNDTLPVKVRFFFAVGPTDWRGLHKSNVS